MILVVVNGDMIIKKTSDDCYTFCKITDDKAQIPMFSVTGKTLSDIHAAIHEIKGVKKVEK